MATDAAGSRTIPNEEALACIVGEVMIRAPKTLPASAAIRDVRQAFERPSIRTVLLADDGRFAGLIERDGVPADAPDDAPAISYLEPAPTTATPDTPMSEAIELLEGRSEPRLVVLDVDGVTLRGLVCVNSTGTGFCRR
jgi:CBS domain-containing protein